MRIKQELKEKYINELFAKESKDLVNIKESHGHKLGVNISAYEGKILQFLIRLGKIKRVIEIGTLRAYSTVWMAEALPDDGEIISIEFNKEAYEKSLANVEASDQKHKIKIIHGDAREILPTLEGEFDMAFIDANKSAYIDYLDWCESHIKQGGLIIGDNTFLFGHLTGEPTDHKVSPNQKKNMQIFNERLADANKYMSVMFPTDEGMTLGILN